MRILVVLICSLALVSVAVGAQKEEKKSQPRKSAEKSDLRPQSGAESRPKRAHR